MEDIRCGNDGRMLGKIDGKYEIKCPRCGCLNIGDTKSSSQVCKGNKHVPLMSTSTPVRVISASTCASGNSISL